MPTFPIVVVRQSDREPLYLQVRAKLELGRDCDGVLLADPLVSRRHVAISEDGGRVVVEDLGSTNGTFLDGTRLESPTILRAGSFLRFGSTTVELAESPLPDMSAPPQRPATMVGGVSSADLVRPGGPGLSRETSIDAVAREVSGHHGQITGLKQHGGTLTIVFSDIESSTEAAVAMGDAAWISVLGAHTAIVRKSLKRWGGTEVKNQGDGFMLSFTGARQALCCMTEVQKELAKQAGIKYSALKNLWQGRTLDPKYSTMRAIARALGVSVEQLEDDTPGQSVPRLATA